MLVDICYRRNMAKRKNQRKGIFCLEGHWWGVRDKSTVEPVLRLLEQLKGLYVPYRYCDVGTREELEFYLQKWSGANFGDFPILYLAFHGDIGKIHVGDGRNTDVKLEALAEQLEGKCGGRVIHFGACGTLRASAPRRKRFLDQTGALAICGYTRTVDWLESAAFDLMVLGLLQNASFRRTHSVRLVNEKLQRTVGNLYESLGFRMDCLD